MAALALPNPNHPLTPDVIRTWLSSRPNGYLENVASIPLLVVIVGVVAWRRGWRPPWHLVVLTVGFGLLALGPFVHLAGQNTHVPAPWAVLRYVPILGMARMPARFDIVMMLGVAALFAIALRWLMDRHPAKRRLLCSIVTALLFFELLPAPRTLYSARIPAIYNRIAADPRPDVRVLELPFGVRDGISSVGRFTARTQFFQTHHGKALAGGYLSRISRRRLSQNRRDEMLSALAWLSEGRPLGAAHAHGLTGMGSAFIERTRIGYVVIDRELASEALMHFALKTFALEQVDADGRFELFVPRLASHSIR